MRPNGRWVKERWATRRWSDRSTVLGVAVTTATIAALAVGGIALADNAAESGNDTTTATSDQPRADAKDRLELRGHRPLGRPMAWALHGEFVTVKKGGGYQTVAVQRGEVQATSDTSITVKSDDGYSRSYVVDDETLVNAHRDGIGSVDVGDDVHVAAVVSGDTATALRIADVSDRRATWEHFRPRWRGLGPGTDN